MSARIVCAIIAFAALSTPDALSAQTMVTFEAPVKLTQLSPQIEWVRMYCQIKSTAIVAPNPGQVSAMDEVPVVAGNLETTMRVVITFPEGTLQAPVGKTATYTCFLQGRTQTGLSPFNGSTSPVFTLTPNPLDMTGTFVW